MYILPAQSFRICPIIPHKIICDFNFNFWENFFELRYFIPKVSKKGSKYWWFISYSKLSNACFLISIGLCIIMATNVMGKSFALHCFYLCVNYIYHLFQSESGLLKGFDKNSFAILLNNSGFDAGVKWVSPGIIHNWALDKFL